MITFLRKHSKYLFPILLVIIGLGFVSYTNFTPNPSAYHENTLGKIDGESINRDSFQAGMAATALFNAATHSQERGRENDQQLAAETWQRMLLLATARQYGLEVDDRELRDFFSQLFAGQDNRPDLAPSRYQAFKSAYLIPQGITDARFFQILTEQIQIAQMERVIVAPVNPTPVQVQEYFQSAFGPVKLSVINLTPAAFLSKVSVTPDEVEKNYQEGLNHQQYYTDEKRKVAYVLFPIPPEIQKLTGQQKTDATEKISRLAEDFIASLVPEKDATAPDFAAAAKQKGLTPGVTGYFGSREPAAPLPPSPNLNAGAFGLSQESTISAPVETDAGFYVLKLVDVQPGKPKPLAEVKAQIEERLKMSKAYAAMGEAGQALAKTLREKVQAGVAFKTAAAELKQPAEDLPVFVPANLENRDTKLDPYRRVAVNLKTGEVSPLFQTATGAAIVYLDSRQPAPQASFAQFQQTLLPQAAEQGRMAALESWVAWRSQTPGTVPPRGLVNE